MNTISAISNPRDGTTLPVKAGEILNIAFEIENDNPLDVVGFYLAIADLPAEWWSGPQSANPRQVVAGGRDILMLTLQPAAGAQPANYPFSVQIQAVNELAGVPSACNLTLSVERGAEPAPAPQDIVEVETVEPEVVQPAVVEPAVVEAPPPPQPAPPPPPQPVAPPLAETKTPPPAPAVTVSAPKPVQVEEPVKPVPKAAAPPPAPKPAPRQPAPKPAEPAPVETVSLQREPVAVEVQQKVAPLPEADRQVINPEDRRILHMLPGERMLLRFKFHNMQNFACNYILDEDRMAALPDGWLERTQAQVNLTPNAEGEVFCLLTPPANARPGEYQFAVFIGAQHAERPEERYYTLLIEATPAVTLAAKEAKKQAGPFGYEATFPLTVANAGNSETAFRVAAREPKAQADTDEEAQLPRDIYETPNWTYQIDNEVENLKAPAQGRDLKPVEVSLHVRRRGPWWFGFQESHTVNVAAVPVTDITNGGKGENVAQVTIKRWRLLPFPYIFLLPIILIFLLAGSQAWNLRVTNGLQVPGKNEFYVFGSLPLQAKIAWDAFPLVPQRLNFSDGQGVFSPLHHAEKKERLEEKGTKYGKVISCSVRNRNVNITFVPKRTDDRLEVLANGRPLQAVQFEGDDSGAAKLGLARAQYNLTVSQRNYTQLSFHNTDMEGSQINIHVFLQPERSVFGILNITDRAPESGTTTQPVKIKALEPGAEGQLVFVTTDSEQQYIRVNLMAE